MGVFNLHCLSIIVGIFCAKQRFDAKRTALFKKLCLKILLESVTHVDTLSLSARVFASCVFYGGEVWQKWSDTKSKKDWLIFGSSHPHNNTLLLIMFRRHRTAGDRELLLGENETGGDWTLNGQYEQGIDSDDQWEAMGVVSGQFGTITGIELPCLATNSVLGLIGKH